MFSSLPLPPSSNLFQPMSDQNPQAENEPWRKRKMVGGRWVYPDQVKKSERVDKPVTVKLTEAELAELDAVIEKIGMKRNRALRIAARRIAGFVEVDDRSYAELRGIARTISGIATNVNQIAKVANYKKDPDLPRFYAEREKLGRELGRLQAVLQPLLDIGKRRTDGLQRLKDASE